MYQHLNLCNLCRFPMITSAKNANRLVNAPNATIISINSKFDSLILEIYRRSVDDLTDFSCWLIPNWFRKPRLLKCSSNPCSKSRWNNMLRRPWYGKARIVYIFGKLTGIVNLFRLIRIYNKTGIRTLTRNNMVRKFSISFHYCGSILFRQHICITIICIHCSFHMPQERNYCFSFTKNKLSSVLCLIFFINEIFTYYLVISLHQSLVFVIWSSSLPCDSEGHRTNW